MSKRSAALVILGCYVILFGLTKGLWANFAEPKDLIVGNITSLLLIVCGLGLFFRSKYARLVLITYFFGMGTFWFVSRFLDFSGALIHLNQPTNDLAGHTNFEALIWSVIFMVFIFCFYFLPVYILSRPEVKEQFK